MDTQAKADLSEGQRIKLPSIMLLDKTIDISYNTIIKSFGGA